ncbi:hypothetical protein EYC95_27390 [Pseudomonas sp. BGI-2]|nr:hypothetical protein EYC95_27390 [Pseudomonas sp. BGI-2]
MKKQSQATKSGKKTYRKVLPGRRFEPVYWYRVGGGFTSAVLSHHRTYGSVYGGSGYAIKPFIVSSIETKPSRSHSFFGSA